MSSVTSKIASRLSLITGVVALFVCLLLGLFGIQTGKYFAATQRLQSEDPKKHFDLACQQLSDFLEAGSAVGQSAVTNYLAEASSCVAASKALAPMDSEKGLSQRRELLGKIDALSEKVKQKITSDLVANLDALIRYASNTVAEIRKSAPPSQSPAVQHPVEESVKFLDSWAGDVSSKQNILGQLSEEMESLRKVATNENNKSKLQACQSDIEILQDLLLRSSKEGQISAMMQGAKAAPSGARDKNIAADEDASSLAEQMLDSLMQTKRYFKDQFWSDWRVTRELGKAWIASAALETEFKELQEKRRQIMFSAYVAAAGCAFAGLLIGVPYLALAALIQNTKETESMLKTLVNMWTAQKTE